MLKQSKPSKDDIKIALHNTRRVGKKVIIFI